MFCPNCGQELSDQKTVCPNCGQAFSDPPPTEETPENETKSFSNTEPDEESADAPANDETISDAESSVTNKDVPDGTSDIVEPVTPDETETTETSDETASADGPANLKSDHTISDTQTPHKKKHSVLTVVLTAIIGLLLIIVVCLVIALTTLSKTGSMPGFVTAITELFQKDNFDPDAIAVTIQDENGNELTELTNAQFSYYYWGEYYYYVQTNGFGFDASKPLSEQQYSDDMTWHDFFLQNACTSIQQIESLKAAATEAGFTMPETYQSEYDSTISSMADYAQQAGFTDSDGNGDVLAYIQDSYGSAATEESFEQYLYDSYYVTAYSDEIYNSLSFTDDEIESYYDDNSDMFTSYGIEKSDQPNVNVRHILIEPADTSSEGSESSAVEDSAAEEASEEAAWADAEEEAERIYEEWKSGDATEESFGELANTYSADTGSNTTGGLYEDVYPGQMVTEFNDWCFDTSRQPGDTAIIRTSFGYHIMYYVGATENYYWKTTAESELRYQEYDAKLNEIVEQYSTITTEELAVTQPDAVEAIQSNASTESTAAG